MPEDRNDDHDRDKVNPQKTMRDFEVHAEQWSCSLTVCVQIVQHGQHDQDGKESIQHDQEKVIDLRPLESRFVESLNIKNHKLCDQKKRKNIHVLFDRRNSLYGIDRNDVEIEPEEVGVEKSERDSDNIAQDKQPYQAASLPLNHS
jgi:hypothetical protein